MLPINPFRNSLYISLALSMLCIGTAGYDLLPEFPYLTAFSLMLLGVAYAMDGRFELNLRDANLVGLFLSVMLGLWGIFQFVRPPTGLSDILPWPASALPYLAPVVMVLMPAKLFRPKHTGDYWTMHGLGMVSVSLACAMASEGLFVVVFIAYAISFIWGLAMFQIYREVGSELSQRVPVLRSRGRELRPAFIRAVIVGAIAVPLFWMTPRSGQNWQLGFNNRGKTTGLNEGAVDMNGSGAIEINREKIFEVRVTNKQGEPFSELSGDLRWRVAQLQQYIQGRWQRDTTLRGPQLAERVRMPATPVSDPRQNLPDFGPQTLYFEFSTGGKMGRNQPLADPLVWISGEYSPIVGPASPEGKYPSWSQRLDGSFDGGALGRKYYQAWREPADYNQSEEMWTIGPPNGLTQVPKELKRLQEFSENLLQRLVRQGRLPADTLSNRDPVVSVHLDPKHHEAVAKAFCEYFATSGEFQYTLDLTRIDKTIDPVEDFVINVRAGHCQRFASALALSLRTLGVPSQLVLGYRGLEFRDDGWYDIREDLAHAWVEVLVPVNSPKLPMPTNLPAGIIARDLKSYRWAILDPTPSGAEGPSTQESSFLDKAKERWESTMKSLLLSYNAESRERTAKAVQDWFLEGNGWMALTGLFASLFFGRMIWKRWRIRRAVARIRSSLPTYMLTLLDLLAKRGLERNPTETQLEFAQTASERLRAEPTTQAVADVPTRLVNAYYAERFGLRSPAQAVVDELMADCRRLATALQSKA